MIIYFDIDDDVLLSALQMADAQSCPVTIILNDAVREYAIRKQHEPEPQGRTIGEAETLNGCPGEMGLACPGAVGVPSDETINNEPVPAWAAVLDGHFVNAYTGLSLGHDFDLKWKARIAEFNLYVDLPTHTGTKRPAHDERGRQSK